MLTIFRGDDTAFAKFDRRVCIGIRTFDDLTGWTASFELFDNKKVFTDIASGLITFGYTSCETMRFPLGLTYGKLTMNDSKGHVRCMKRVEVEIQDKIPCPDAGEITIAADMVISDYDHLGHIPTINGKQVKGDHTGEYYGLGSQEAVAGNTAMLAVHASKIADIREQGQRNAASIADQGVAIAKTAQALEGVKKEQNALAKDVADIKRKTKDVDEAIAHAIKREADERKAEDSILRDAIDAERDARTNGDRSLRADLDTEIATRESEVAALRQADNAERTVRESGEKRLEDALRTEAQNRTSGDEALSEQVRSFKSQFDSRLSTAEENIADVRRDVTEDLRRESETRASADTAIRTLVEDTDRTLSKKVADETAERKDALEKEMAARKDADAKIGARLVAEIHAREFTDNAVVAEATKRSKADAELDAKIAKEAEDRAKGDADTLKEAKDYADHIGEHALHFKGSKEYFRELLAVENPAVGDMWNVEKNDDGSRLGANFAWDGSKWDKLSETIDLRPYALKVDVAAEVARLDARDGELQAAIDDEKTARETAVANEAKARSDGDEAIRAALTQEITDRANADTLIRQSVEREASDRQAGDEEVKNLLATRVEELKADDHALGVRIDSVQAAVETERTARIEADNTERTAREEAIAAEATARENAVNTEAEARERADGVLDGKIEAEKEERIANDKTEIEARKQAVSNEATARKDADDALGTRIDTEIADRVAAVEHEKELREQADNLIYQKITLEEQESVARDNAITEALTEEKSERIAADTTERNERIAGDAQTLADAKAYADAVGAKAMHFKGSVHDRAALEAITDMAQGDMYNVEEYEYDDGTIVKGANFAWTGVRWDKLSEFIDLTPYALKVDVAAEVARLDGRDAELQASIEAEATARVNADTALGNRITNEVTDRTNADIAISQALEVEVGERKNADTALGNRIDEEKEARKDADENEKTARQNADTALGTRITTEVNDRVAAVANEKDLRTQADALLEEKMTIKEQESISRDNAITEALNTERSERIEAVNTERAERVAADAQTLADAKEYADTVGAKAMHFKGSLPDRAALESIVDPKNGDMYNVEVYEYDDGTVVKGANFAWNGNPESPSKGWDKLSENIDLTPFAKKDDVELAIAALQTKDEELEAAIGAEKTARENADTTLAGSIATEKTARENADTALGNRIDAEKEARENADANEKTARQNADDALGTRIDTEISDRTAAVANEKDLRTQADNLIYEKIELERQQSVARDTALGERVTAEVTARETADSAEAEARVAGDAQTLADAKAYADTVGAKAMHFKGSVHDRAALEAITDMAQGDMYNVEEYEFDDGSIVKGANFAWTGVRWDKLSETIDLTPYAIKSDVDGEIESVRTEFRGADTALGERIDANTTAIEGNTAEITTVKGSVTALGTRMTEAEGAITAEVERAKTRENAIESALTEEVNERKEDTAEVKLLVTNEATARANADTALDTAIGEEVVRAKDKEAELKLAIETEASRALLAEGHEKTAREEGDVETLRDAKNYCDTKHTALETQINDTKTRVQTLENQVNATETGILARLEKLENFLAAIFPDHGSDTAKTVTLRWNDTLFNVSVTMVDDGSGSTEPAINVEKNRDL